MKTSELAIILSVYSKDTLSFVSSAVESLLKQTVSDFDIFIQKDGPLDPAVEDYLQTIRDGRIRCYQREENKGLAHSLNDLLSIVLPLGYPYIARMDADDICAPDRLERQLRYLELHPEVDCAGTWAIEILSDGTEFFRKRMPEHHDECLALFRKRDCIIHPTAVFRRSFFERAGVYETDSFFAEDTMMWAKGFAAGCRFANVPEYLYEFRLDSNFFERRRGWKYAKGILEVRKRVNKMLGFGLKEALYAYAYAFVKLLPTPILRIIYKTFR